MTELSEQYLMWATNEANGLKRTEGYNPDYLVKGLCRFGIADEQSMPYVPHNEPLGIPSARARDHARRRLGARLTSIKHWSTRPQQCRQDNRPLGEVGRVGMRTKGRFEIRCKQGYAYVGSSKLCDFTATRTAARSQRSFDRAWM